MIKKACLKYEEPNYESVAEKTYCICLHLLLTAFAFANAHPRSAAAQQAPALTNDLILELVEAGFSSEKIIRQIKRSPCHFDTSPSRIEKLKSRGVSALVIKAMIDVKEFDLPDSIAPLVHGERSRICLAD